MPAFLSNGMTYADFILDGTIPYCRDQQKSRLRNGAKSASWSFSSRVGRGSEEHWLSGSAWISLTTSAGVTGWKNLSSQPTGAVVNCGVGAPAEASRTLVTLSSNKRCRTDAPRSAVVWALPRPSSFSKDWNSVIDVSLSRSWALQKRLNKCRLGAVSAGPKEPCVKWGCRSFKGKWHYDSLFIASSPHSWTDFNDLHAVHK